MKNAFFILTALLFSVCCSALMAQVMVEESSTGKQFPKTITLTYGDATHELQLTGTTVRKKYFFKVYAVAHYMEGTEKMSESAALAAALSDGKAKEIVMDFVRDVSADKIQGAYRETFEKNTTPEELKEIQPLVDRFVGYYTDEIKDGQQYVLRWFPGGVVVPIIDGQEKPVIVNEVFARALWSAWLGKDAIVKAEKLVELMVK